MYRLLSAICQPVCDYFSLTVIEPFQSIFPSTPKSVPNKYTPVRQPAPSVFRTIVRQRQMMSPKGQYVQLSRDISVTEHYVRRNSQPIYDIRPQGYLH